MEIVVSEEIKTIEAFDYILLAFDKKWSKLFGDPMTFTAKIDKSGRLNLISTKSIPNFQPRKRHKY